MRVRLPLNLPAHLIFIRRFGLFAWPVLLFGRALARYLSVRLSVVYALDPKGVPTDFGDGFTVRPLERHEIDWLVENREWDLSASFVEHATRDGHRCIGAFRDAQLCGYAWYATGWAEVEPNVVIHPLDARTYSFKHFTHPSVRGLAAQKCLACAALEASRLSGGRGLLTVIRVDNFPSRRSVKRLSARAVGLLLVRGRRRVKASAWQFAARSRLFMLRALSALAFVQEPLLLSTSTMGIA